MDHFDYKFAYQTDFRFAQIFVPGPRHDEFDEASHKSHSVLELEDFVTQIVCLNLFSSSLNCY